MKKKITTETKEHLIRQTVLAMANDADFTKALRKRMAPKANKGAYHATARIYAFRLVMDVPTLMEYNKSIREHIMDAAVEEYAAGLEY